MDSFFCSTTWAWFGQTLSKLKTLKAIKMNFIELFFKYQ